MKIPDFIEKIKEPARSSIIKIITKERSKKIIRNIAWFGLVGMILVSFVLIIVFGASINDRDYVFNDFIPLIISCSIFVFGVAIVPWLIIVPRRMLIARAAKIYVAKNLTAIEVEGIVVEKEVMLSGVSGVSKRYRKGGISFGMEPDKIIANGNLCKTDVYIKGSDRFLQSWAWNDSYKIGDKVIVSCDPQRSKFCKIIKSLSLQSEN